jgi:hypothetical protein
MVVSRLQVEYGGSDRVPRVPLVWVELSYSRFARPRMLMPRDYHCLPEATAALSASSLVGRWSAG